MGWVIHRKYFLGTNELTRVLCHRPIKTYFNLKPYAPTQVRFWRKNIIVHTAGIHKNSDRKVISLCRHFFYGKINNFLNFKGARIKLRVLCFAPLALRSIIKVENRWKIPGSILAAHERADRGGQSRYALLHAGFGESLEEKQPKRKYRSRSQSSSQLLRGIIASCESMKKRL